MDNLFSELLKTIESGYIPNSTSKSWQIFNLLPKGVKRKDLRLVNESFHGSPLENLEGEKYGYWLIDRYKDNEGDSCLKFNYRHLTGCKVQDREARRLRRKDRAEFSLKKAEKEIKRIPKALSELNQAQMDYLLLLGDAANDPVMESKKLTED